MLSLYMAAILARKYYTLVEVPGAHRRRGSSRGTWWHGWRRWRDRRRSRDRQQRNADLKMAVHVRDKKSIFIVLARQNHATFVPYRVCWLWDLSHYDVCHLFMKFVDKRVCRSIKILVRFKKKEKNCPNRGLEIWRVLHYQNRIITNGHQLHISTFYIVFRSSKGLNKAVQHCGYAVKATFCYFWIILCACMPPFLSKQWWAWCRGGPRGGWTGGRTSCGGGRRRSPACPGTWRGSTTRSRPGPPRPCSCKYRVVLSLMRKKTESSMSRNLER